MKFSHIVPYKKANMIHKAFYALTTSIGHEKNILLSYHPSPCENKRKRMIYRGAIISFWTHTTKAKETPNRVTKYQTLYTAYDTK